MNEDSAHSLEMHGNVGKLTTIGTVNGNVLIVSERAVKENLKKPGRSSRLHSSGYPVEDVTDYIKVVVKSNRFGRKIQFKVSQDMTVKAFIDLVVDLLELPWSRSIDELMLSFSFRYSVVFGEEKLSLSKTLNEAGIADKDEVQLSISSIWTDELERAERKEAEMGDVMYEMGGRMRVLENRRLARQARGVLTRDKIKSLADGCFSYVDEIG